MQECLSTAGDFTMVVILFDLEGTLIQTKGEDPGATFEFRRQTRKKLIELGVPPDTLKGVDKSTLMRNKALDYVKVNFSRDKTRMFHDELQKFLQNYELDWARSSKLYSQTIPTLHELRKLGYKMGLVTNTSKKAVELIFSMYPIEEYFEVVVTREDTKRLKPDPEGVFLALERPDEEKFFLVGDLIYDAQAAEKAGGSSIIVKRDPCENLSFHADYVVQSLAKIPILVQKLQKKTK